MKKLAFFILLSLVTLGVCDDQPALSGTAFDGWCSDTYGQQF